MRRYVELTYRQVTTDWNNPKMPHVYTETVAHRCSLDDFENSFKHHDDNNSHTRDRIKTLFNDWKWFAIYCPSHDQNYYQIQGDTASMKSKHF